jgi:hypothetical protein
MFQVNLVMILGLIPVVLIIPTIALLFLFFSKYIKTHHIMFGYLSALFGFYLLSNFLEMGQFLADYQEIAELLLILSEIFKALVIYVLILLLDMFYSNKRFSQRQTLITILVFLLIGGLLTNPELETTVITQGYLINIQTTSILNLLEAIFRSTATIILLVILIKSIKSAWSPRQKKLIIWLLIGTIIGILMPSFPRIAFNQAILSDQIGFMVAHLLQGIPQSIGILIIGIAFVKVSKNPWLLQRQKVDFLVVYDHGGLNLYSKIFSKEISSNDTILLAGAFSAVTSLIEESTKSTGNVESVVLQGKELRVVNREGFICALLVEYTTQASEWALNKFTSDFETRFKEKLKNFAGEVSVFNTAEEIAIKYFT